MTPGRPSTLRGTDGVALTVRLSRDERDLLERVALRSGARSAADFTRLKALTAARRDAGGNRGARRGDVSCWVECDWCGMLVHDPSRSLTLLSKPAPCCGATGCRIIWPSNARFLLEGLASLETTEEVEGRAASLILAAACEALLGEVLWKMFERLEIMRTVALALDKRASDRGRKLSLYADLAGVSAKEVLVKKGHGAWYQAWDELVDTRNQIAHGEWYAGKKGRTLAELVQVVEEGVIDAFATLHNFAIERIAVQRSEWKKILEQSAANRAAAKRV